MMKREILKALKTAPGFLQGGAAVWDMGATLYNRKNDDKASDADYRALASDWAKTGKDLYAGMSLYQETHEYR